MTKYEITHPDITLWVWYRAGKVVKLQLRRGSLADREKAFENLHQWVPSREDSIDRYDEHWAKISYRRLSGDAPSMYKLLVADWFRMYSALNGVEYKFTGQDGKAVKQIEKYLVGNFGEDAHATWQAILSGWDSLPDFYRRKADLVFVNSKLNEIITHLKDNDSFKAATDSQDLRSEL